MPIVPLFTSSQNQGVPGTVILEDTSTGSDVAITSRRVFFIKRDGTYLVPTGTTTNYVAWDYADDTITITDILDKDYAVNVVVQWLDVSNTVLYTKTVLIEFSMFNDDFEYGLVEDEANGQASINDTNWFMSRIKLRVYLDSALIAITDGSNITSGQANLDMATYLRQNPNIFY